MNFEKRKILWRNVLKAKEGQWLFDGAIVDVYVAEMNENLVGFCAWSILKESGSVITELNALYVLPEVQGQNIGSELLQIAKNIFSKNDIRLFYVWVFEDNPYHVFYQHRGGVMIPQRKVICLDDTSLNTIGYKFEL